MSRPVGPSIRELSPLTQQKICKFLDVSSETGEDFRTLAANVGMSIPDLDIVAQGKQPTHSVLSWWGRRNEATIPKLRKILVSMGRLDCVGVLDKDPKAVKDNDSERETEETISGAGPALLSDEDSHLQRATRLTKKRSSVKSFREPKAMKKRRTKKGEAAQLVLAKVPGSAKENGKMNQVPDVLVREMDFETRTQICSLLDVEMPIENNDGRMLGEKIGLKQNQVRLAWQGGHGSRSSPTAQMLQQWGIKNRATVGKLREILVKMGREDVIKVIDEKYPQLKGDAEKQEEN